MEDREVSLEINGKQSVKLEIGTIKFKNYFKQIVVPFKIYADLESLLKGLQINDKNKNTSCTEKYQIIFLAVLLTKLYVLVIDLANQLFL